MKKKIVSFKQLVDEFKLDVIYSPCDLDKIFIVSPYVNRPGLNICGFYECFKPNIIQIFGNAEIAYLKRLSEDVRFKRLLNLCEKKILAIIIAESNEVFFEVIKVAKIFKVPVLKTNEDSCFFMAYLISYLNMKLGPKIGMHGVLVEVCDEGVLIVGESGIGKSETAMELIKRGHRLVADDEVLITKVSNKILVGKAPENIKNFIELRGIGILNVKELYGVRSIKTTKKIDMMVYLKNWEDKENYDRIGLKTAYVEILGVEIPKYVIPVKVGRNLALILEVAAINNRQKKVGYNAAKDLFSKLGFIDVD